MHNGHGVPMSMLFGGGALKRSMVVFMGRVMPYWLVSSSVSVCELCSSYFFVVPSGIFYLCNLFFAPLLCPVVLLLL